MLQLRRVVGNSMLPSYKPGQLLVVSTRPKKLITGQAVILAHNGVEKLKRIDRIMDDRVYVIGDNQQASTDSRQFGWLDSSHVVATVIWPKA